MVGSERSLWGTLHRNLGPYGVIRRIENAAGIGTPDVVYCLKGRAGWLELKNLHSWPVRPATPLRVPHLTIEQVLWLEEWVATQGRADTLLQVDRTYLLLDPVVTRRLFERALTQADIRAEAKVVGENRLPTQELLKWLTRD